MLHFPIIKNQFSAISHLKRHLEVIEVIIHMDFSENYKCKYQTKIQSAHFGGSKSQITLHTVNS